MFTCVVAKIKKICIPANYFYQCKTFSDAHANDHFLKEAQSGLTMYG